MLEHMHSRVYYAYPYVAIFNPCWFIFDLDIISFKFKPHLASKIYLHLKESHSESFGNFI